MKQVELYTDGACSGNPGKGGYGIVLCYGSHRLELSGGYRLTTNNRMELLAAVEGLRPRSLAGAFGTALPPPRHPGLGQGARRQCAQQPLRRAGGQGRRRRHAARPRLSEGAGDFVALGQVKKDPPLTIMVRNHLFAPSPSTIFPLETPHHLEGVTSHGKTLCVCRQCGNHPRVR